MHRMRTVRRFWRARLPSSSWRSTGQFRHLLSQARQQLLGPRQRDCRTTRLSQSASWRYPRPFQATQKSLCQRHADRRDRIHFREGNQVHEALGHFTPFCQRGRSTATEFSRPPVGKALHRGDGSQRTRVDFLVEAARAAVHHRLYPP